MEEIQFIGRDKLDMQELAVAEKLAQEYYPKIQRTANAEELKLVLHIRNLRSEGKQRIFDLDVRAVMGKKVFSYDREGWKLTDLLHQAFQGIQKQMQHQMHTDDQHPKGSIRKREAEDRYNL